MAGTKNIAVEVILRAVAKQYQRAMGESASSTRKFDTQLSETTETGSSNLARLGKAAQRLSKYITGAAVAFAGAKLASAIGEASSTYETLAASILFVEDSAEAAAKRIDELSRFARKNGQDLSNVISSYVRLKNLGLDPSTRALKAFLNVAAATRGKTLIDFIEAVADTITGGFERLNEFGIKARVESDKIALTFRGSTTIINSDARSIQNALRQIGEVQFAGAVESQLKTTAAATRRAGAATKSLLAVIDETTGYNESVGILANAWASVAENLSQTEHAAQGAKTQYTGLTKLVLDGVKALNDYIDKSQTQKYGVDPGLEGEERLNALLQRRDELLEAIKQQTQQVAEASRNNPIREAFFPELPREEAQLRKLQADLRQVEGLLSGAMDRALDEVDSQFKALGGDADQAKIKISQFGQNGVSALRALVTEAKAIKREFDELDAFLNKSKTTLPASLASVSQLRDKALGQIGTGDAQGAIETLRQARELLKQVAEEANESSLFLGYWAKALRRVAEDAVAAKAKVAKAAQPEGDKAAREWGKVINAADAAQEAISDINTVNVKPSKGIAEIEDAATGLKRTLDDLPADGIKLEDNAPEVSSKIKGIQREIDLLVDQDHVIKIRVEYDQSGIPTFSNRAGGPIFRFAAGGHPRRLRPGIIQGPGTATSDSIHALVSRGEHAFITNAARAAKLWPLLNKLNFGSDAFVNRVLASVRSGLPLPPALAPGGPLVRPLPNAVGSYAGGGPVTSGLQPVVINLTTPVGKTESIPLFGERAAIAKAERISKEAQRGRRRG